MFACTRVRTCELGRTQSAVQATFKRKNGIRSAKIAFHEPVSAFE
ncbi:hypothetical protein HMPREF1492_0865 [Atopobium sp. BS2]|nr:hypothetical protein HMPREF1492_0865 [Atopobium sp. BS2]